VETGEDRKAFYASLAALALPMTLQNLISAAVQSADVVMLGLAGQASLSASSLANQVSFVLMLLIFGVCSGATVLTAQYWGKGDQRAIARIMAITLRLSLGAAAVFFCAAEFFPRPLMRLFTDEPELIGLGALYLRYCAPAWLFSSLSNTYLNILRSVEKVLVATVIYCITVGSNIGLNALLIFGLLGFPKMGIAGAALATTISRGLELTITAVYALRSAPVRFRRSDFLTADRTLLRDLARYAGPTTLNELMWSLAVAANAVVIGHMGQAAVAANSITQVVRQLATAVCFGLASSAAVLLGKVLGRSDFLLAKQQADRLLRLTLAAGCAGALFILLARPFVLRTMNVDEAARELLSFSLFWISGYAVAQAFNTTMIVGIFRSGGDTRFGLLCDVGSMYFGSILLGALGWFVFHWPVRTVYMVLMCDEFIKIPLTLWRYRTKIWLRNVTR